jgi:hypothetical protein
MAESKDPTNDDNAPWHEKDPECKICFATDIAQVHTKCGNGLCATCLGGITGKESPTCPFCQQSLVGQGALLPHVIPTTTAAQVEPDACAQAAGRAAVALMDIALAAHVAEKRQRCVGDLRVRIKHTDGLFRSASVDAACTVFQLKRCIAFHDGLAPEQLRLIHRGLPLVDDKSLSQQGIRAFDRLHVLLHASVRVLGDPASLVPIVLPPLGFAAALDANVDLRPSAAAAAACGESETRHRPSSLSTHSWPPPFPPHVVTTNRLVVANPASHRVVTRAPLPKILPGR